MVVHSHNKSKFIDTQKRSSKKMYSKTWDTSFKKGKKRIERLLQIIPTLNFREDLQTAVKKDPLLKRTPYSALTMKLLRETEVEPKTPLGEAWSKVPRRPHMIERKIPDQKRLQRFKKDAREMTLSELRRTYPEIKDMSKGERTDAFAHLGVRRPFAGGASTRGPARGPKLVLDETTPLTKDNWWLFVQRDDPEHFEDWKERFLARFRSNFRLDGNSNEDLLREFPGCPSWNGLGIAARALGEMRSRLQIMAAEKILVWSPEADKVLAASVVESKSHSPYVGEGYRQLRELKGWAILKLKEIGLSRISEESLKKRLSEISQERLNELGFDSLQAPLRWGSKSGSPQARSMEKKISARMTELILRGVLKEPGGIEAFRQQILNEFANEIRQNELDFSERRFKGLVDKLVWTEGPDGVATKHEQALIARDERQMQTFKDSFRHIPSEMVDKQTEYKRGITRILYPSPITAQETLRGIGRLFSFEEMAELQKRELPRHGFHNPYKVRAPENWSIMAPSGINFGIEFNPVMEQNRTRQIFACAEDNGSQVLVTSGLVEIDNTKASGIVKALRALVSGRDIGVNLLAPNYRESARRILETLPADETLCVTTREAFDDLMTGLWDVTHKPDKNDPESKKFVPEFNGKVLMILGPKEEEVAVSAAAAAVLKNVLTKLSRIRSEKGMTEAALRPYVKELRRLEEKRKELQDQVEGADETEKAELESQTVSLTEEINKLVERDIKPLQQKIEDLIDQEARERISNVDPREWKRFIRAAIAYLVKRIEEAIPNCKVIGRGTTYIQVGNKIIECFIPGHLQVTRNLAAEYIRSYGGRVRRKQMADAVIIFHPYSFYCDLNSRRVDYGGRVERDVLIVVAPTSIDGAYLRPLYANIVRKVHPIAKLVSSELFAPGVLRLTCSNGVISPETYTMEALGYYYRKVKASPAFLKILKRIDGKNIHIHQNADEHIGSGSKDVVECRKCRVRMGMNESFFHLLRHNGYGSPAEGKKLVPIHMVVMSDDGVQGDPKSFFKHRQPHRHQLSREQKQKFVWKDLGQKLVRAATVEEREKILELMERTDMHQMEIRGEHWIEDQIREMKQVIERNADIYDSILQRFISSGIRLKPASELINQPHIRVDSCDAGVINNFNGNHLGHSVDGHLMEGSLYMDHLIGCLMAFPHWYGKKHILEKYIKAPRYENVYLGAATMQAPGLRGPETMYGLELRGNIPAGPEWFDLLKKQAPNELSRGNLLQFFEEIFVLWFCGNSHFLAQIMMALKLLTMGAPGTHTDSFAEKARGLPPNVSGINIVSVPAGGPNDGPITLKPFMYSDLRRFLEEGNPTDFDVDSFLPNPL